MKNASYNLLSSVVQRSLGQSSRTTPSCFVTMKVLSANMLNGGDATMDYLQVNVTTIVTHKDVESLRLVLREEAMEATRKSVQQAIIDYKEEVKSRKKYAKDTGQDIGDPADSIKLEILGETLYDDFVYVSSNSLKSHCKTAYYRFHIKARIL